MANDIITRISAGAPIIGRISGLSTEAALLAVQDLTARTGAAEEDIDALQTAAASLANTKADKADTYTKVQVDDRDALKVNKDAMLTDSMIVNTLPNGTKDTFQNGQFTKRIGHKIIEDSDFTSILTSYPDVDFVLIKKPTDYIYVTTNNSVLGTKIIEGVEEQFQPPVNGFPVSLIGKTIVPFSTSQFGIVIAKGTTMSQAKSLYIGKKITYQLATPVTYDLPVSANSNTKEIARISELTNKLDTEKANKVQEAWITPTLLNGWTAFSEAYTPKYYKDGFGVVHLKGIATTGSVSIMLTLPSGYRPAEQRGFVTSANLSPGIIFVTKGGDILLYLGTPTSVYLDVISFKAEG